MFKDKRVVVIGPCEYHSKVLEDFDVVVRVNHYAIKQRGRTDVIYSTSSPQKLRDLLVPIIMDFKAAWKFFNARYECTPFAGMVAVWDVLNKGAQEVFVTGMDFYRDKDGKVPERVGGHKTGPQIQWLVDTTQDGDRLELDKTLWEICIGHTFDQNRHCWTRKHSRQNKGY